MQTMYIASWSSNGNGLWKINQKEIYGALLRDLCRRFEDLADTGFTALLNTFNAVNSF